MWNASDTRDLFSGSGKIVQLCRFERRSVGNISSVEARRRKSTLRYTCTTVRQGPRSALSLGRCQGPAAAALAPSWILMVGAPFNVRRRRQPWWHQSPLAWPMIIHFSLACCGLTTPAGHSVKPPLPTLTVRPTAGSADRQTGLAWFVCFTRVYTECQVVSIECARP